MADICGADVFPEHPEWDVKCNQRPGHATVHARFDRLPPSADVPACRDEDPAQPATLAACYPDPPDYHHPEESHDG